MLIVTAYYNNTFIAAVGYTVHNMLFFFFVWKYSIPQCNGPDFTFIGLGKHEFTITVGWKQHVQNRCFLRNAKSTAFL